MDEDGLERNTAYQDMGTVFANILRVGHVIDADNDKRIARVHFDDLAFNSDWLPVLISLDVIHYYPYDVPQWTEFDTEDREPRAGAKEYADHRHKVIIKPYMPKVNDQVLCLYEPVRNGRGYILGGIREWR